MKAITRLTYSCVLLVASSGLSLEQNSAGPVDVTLCDLYQHPEQYAGRMIRVRGGSVSGLEIDDILHDSHAEPCSAYMRIVVVFPDQVKPTAGFDVVRDDSYKKLEEALQSRRPIHIDGTYVGRFDAAFVWRDHKRIRVGQATEKGYGKTHRYDGRIVLYQVSNVWALLLPHK